MIALSELILEHIQTIARKIRGAAAAAVLGERFKFSRSSKLMCISGAWHNLDHFVKLTQTVFGHHLCRLICIGENKLAAKEPRARTIRNKPKMQNLAVHMI